MSWQCKKNCFLEKDLSDEENDLSPDAKSSEDEGLLVPMSQRSQDSDTEQELSSEEDDRDENHALYLDLTGKDGVTKWSLKPCYTNSHTRPENLDYEYSNVNLCAKNAKTEIDCWKLFFSDGMLEQILYHTNAKIKNKQLSKKKLHDRVTKETTMDELLALFGLMYLDGLNGTHRQNLRELWCTDGTGIEIFRTSMSLQRFSFLQKCLRFETDDDKNKIIDNLAPIRRIFEEFILNCQSAYSPSEYLTIDEKFKSFRGKGPFRQFIRNRFAKEGMKVYALVDAKNFYTINLEIYINQPIGPFSQSNDPYDVVDRLVQPVSQTYRNVSFNNWFTSIPLVTHLLNNHKLTSTGALKKNKPEIPYSFFRNRGGHKVNTSKFGFQETMTLVSYRSKHSKAALVLSSLHHEPRIDPTTDEKQKPEIITFYDSTKSASIMVDELCETYDVSRNTVRWPMAVFYTLMNIAALNSIIIYSENTTSKVNRREFIRKLGLQLLESHLATRKNIVSLPREIRKRIHEHIGETFKDSPLKNSKPRRCKDCPHGKDRKTKYACNMCNKPICLEHVVPVCRNCIGVDSD